jgi:hypothetical protein
MIPGPADAPPSLGLLHFGTAPSSGFTGSTGSKAVTGHLIQLVAVQTNDEINQEVLRAETLWPSPELWRRAEKQQEKAWLQLELIRAARELGDTERATGLNLAPLLFRNRRVRAEYELYQLRERHRGEGMDLLSEVAIARGTSTMWGVMDQAENLPPRVKPPRRGISVREFRLRYKRTDLRILRAPVSTPPGFPAPEHPARGPGCAFRKPVSKGFSILDQYGGRGPGRVPRAHLEPTRVEQYKQQLRSSPDVSCWAQSVPSESKALVKLVLEDPFCIYSDGER